MNTEQEDKKYWLFNVNYKNNPDVWRKCKQYGFVAMHYVEGKDVPGLIKPNIDRMRSISEGDLIIAYSGDKSFLGVGEAIGTYYEEQNPEQYYGIEYLQRVKVDWFIAEDKPVEFDGKKFMRTMGIKEPMHIRTIFPIKQEVYEYALNLMENKAEAKTGSNWTQAENALVIADYFSMLKKKITNEPSNKNEHRLALQKTLQQRSKGSIELKYQNISAVLNNNGYEHIKDYKPWGNYQSILEEMVLTRLQEVEENMLVSQKEVNITIDNYTDYIEDPPAYSEQKAKGHKGSGKIYFHMKEYENKKLGDAGEQFVLNLEKKRLEQLGKEEIKVDWIAKENDFAGYDILSCSKDGQERLIEVKTTNKSKDHPFYLSALEYQTLKDNLDKYFIYRVFDFKENPRCFIISAEQLLELTINPVNYRISFEKPVDNQ